MSRRKKRIIAIIAIIAISMTLVSGYSIFGVGNTYAQNAR